MHCINRSKNSIINEFYEIFFFQICVAVLSVTHAKSSTHKKKQQKYANEGNNKDKKNSTPKLLCIFKRARLLLLRMNERSLLIAILQLEFT